MAGSDSNKADIPAMDYPQHERTYEGFLDFSKVGSIACANILIALVFIYQDSPVLAGLFTVLMLITATIGLAMRPNGATVGLVQFIVGLALVAFNAA